MAIPLPPNKGRLKPAPKLDMRGYRKQDGYPDLSAPRRDRLKMVAFFGGIIVVFLGVGIILWINDPFDFFDLNKVQKKSVVEAKAPAPTIRKKSMTVPKEAPAESVSEVLSEAEQIEAIAATIKIVPLGAGRQYSPEAEAIAATIKIVPLPTVPATQ